MAFLYDRSAHIGIAVAVLAGAACGDDTFTSAQGGSPGTGATGQGGASSASSGGGQGTGTGGGSGVGVPCPDTACPGGTICCATQNGTAGFTYECIGSNDTCAGVALPCDGPEDCSGDPCCYGSDATIYCGANGTCDSGGGGGEVCKASPDCPMGQICCLTHPPYPNWCQDAAGQCEEACLDASDCVQGAYCCQAIQDASKLSCSLEPCP